MWVPRTLAAGQFRYFISEVVVTFAEPFAHFVASESTNRNLLASLRNFVGHQLADSLCRILDERLIEKHEFFIKLV